MSCNNKKIYEELCQYLGEDLENPMCQELKNHVENCAECRQYIKNIKETVILFRSAIKEDINVPEKKIVDIMAKIKHDKLNKNGKDSEC